ncbi:MAG: ferrochelatase [Planctomycetaceae bacterium]|jgi:ferrochelatase|nr:ferrochelatase [Planctomycetaceae bacterium]
MISKTFLLISYGAPEEKEEVIPFLHHLLAGKTDSKILQDRITVASEKYYEQARRTGQLSPLNKECRNLVTGILQETEPYPIALRIYWGNLFWHPLLENTIAQMAEDGIKQAIWFATSMFDSGTSNKRYNNALETACQKIGSAAPIFEKLPLTFDHPMFIEAQTDCLLEALARIVSDNSQDYKSEHSVLVLFSAHSIPNSDTACSNYVTQLRQACRLVIEKSYIASLNIPLLTWELVFQSRSGTAEDWLAPDIKDRIREIAATGQYRTIIVLPIGFFCENMETVNDLDWEIGNICYETGLRFVRARAIGTLQKTCKMIAAEIIKQKHTE